MRSIAVFASGIMIALSLSGCAASGTQVKESQVSQFEKGKTTIVDVVGKLGAPQYQTNQSNGSKILVYSYAQVQTRPETFIPFVGAFVGGADMKTNSATFVFDKDGFLQSTSSSAGASGTGMGFASGTGAPERVADQPRQAQ